MTLFQIAFIVVCLFSAVWLVVLLVQDCMALRVFFNLLAVAELVLFVHFVLGIVRVIGDVSAGVFEWEYIGYLIGVLLFIFVGVVWSLGEKSRGGIVVLLVAVLFVPFMFVWLVDIWSVGG